MNDAGFSRRMRTQHAEAWDVLLSHPFLLLMQEGTLPAAAFRRYMVQDYLYLVEYARVFAIATAKAPDVESMARLAELLHATLNVEMQLHRDFAARVGIQADELASAEFLSHTHAYTRHLLAVAWGESLAVTAAALLPCQLSYGEIGLSLARRGPLIVAEHDEWVRTYSSVEYQTLAVWLSEHADALARRAGPEELRRMERVYQEGLGFERGFWSMALGAAESDQ